MQSTASLGQNTPTLNALEVLLNTVLASAPEQLEGRLIPFDRLCTDNSEPTHLVDPDELHMIGGFRFHHLFRNVPLGVLTAMQFAYHDICNPISIAGFDQKTCHQLKIPGPEADYANARSSTLDLETVYGRANLTGNIARVLDTAMQDPLDPAKFAILGETDKTTDLLRLHQVIVGEGFGLDERIFFALPHWLKSSFFRDAELRLDFAIIPEQRNDQSLLLSQFHCAAIAFHNRTVRQVDTNSNHAFARDQLYETARAFTTNVFQKSVLQNVLGYIAQPEFLSKEILAGLGLRNKQILIEAACCFEAVLAIIRPERIRPRLQTPGRGLRFAEFASGVHQGGLPRDLFISPHIPTRLKRRHSIEWAPFLSDDPSHGFITSAGDTKSVTWSAQRLKTALKIAQTCNLASGQTLAKMIQQGEGPTFDVLSPRDIASLFGLQLSGKIENVLTPLPIYVLAEAELLGQNGRLGPLGSAIIGRTLMQAASDVMESEETIEPALVIPARDRGSNLLAAFLDAKGSV